MIEAIDYHNTRQYVVNMPDSDSTPGAGYTTKRATKPPVPLSEMTADQFLSWAGENGW